MRVPHPGCDVELKVSGVFYDVIPQPDVVHVVLFEGLFQQHSVQNRVNVLSDVLQQTGITKLY